MVRSEHLDERGLRHPDEVCGFGVAEPTLADLIDKPEEPEVG